MGLEKFVILRSSSAATRKFGPSLGTLRGAGPAISDRDGAEVQTAELNNREARDLGRDSDVWAFAPVMRLKLHEPVGRNVEPPQEEAVTWGIQAIGADACPFSGKGVKVAVLDTGVDLGHEAFDRLDIVRANFTDEGDEDEDGHGTHCAGTIFGRMLDGLRIGVAPGIERALVGKVVGRAGGSTEGIARAIQWALDCGANVIAMSLGLDFPGQVARLVERGFPIDLATSRALQAYRANMDLFGALASLARTRGAFFQGTMLVAAAGNESRRDVSADYDIAVAPPAAADGICAVGALEKADGRLRVAAFSNTGADVCAPGVAVTSARRGGGVASMSGTSMAVPHVAGVAALWAEKILKSSKQSRIAPSALSALVVGSGTCGDLQSGFDALDVGTGLVRAPRS